MFRPIFCASLMFVFTLSGSLAESGSNPPLSADLNADQSVTFDDFFLFVEQFGQRCTGLEDCAALTADDVSTSATTPRRIACETLHPRHSDVDATLHGLTVD